MNDSNPVVQETYRMFDEIVAHGGFTYKRPPFVEVTRLPNGWCARWFNGRIEHLPGIDGGTMSHELGHMFHSFLCESCGPLASPFDCDHDGEAVAEAVRYFVAIRMGGYWEVTQNRQVLDKCDSQFDEFKRLIREILRIA